MTLQPRSFVPLPPEELAAEHRALVRQLGGLQSRCSALLSASTAQVTALQADNLRLRAELVICRTSVCWGMAAAVVRRPRIMAVEPGDVDLRDPGAPEAQAVICQTGCVGHAHPWLAPDGQCRRSGDACERIGIADSKG
ncbi:MAG: hypothetical protein R3E56_05990 [Burkholderiaceae bacterium]